MLSPRSSSSGDRAADVAGVLPLVLDKDPKTCLACGGRGCTLCTQWVLNQPHHVPECMACDDQGCSLCRSTRDPNPDFDLVCPPCSDESHSVPQNQHMADCRACDDQGCSLCKVDDGTAVECSRFQGVPLAKDVGLKHIVSLTSCDDERPARVRGFERPFHWQQLLSWAAFGSTILLYPMLLPLFRPEDGLILGLAFFMILVVAVVSSIQVCRVDPKAECLSTDVAYETKYCKHCKKERELDSHHCHSCRKCVVHFDHHCDWFNTCIGAKNYGNFLVAIVAVLLLLAMATATSGILLCFHMFDIDIEGDGVDHRWRAVYGDLGDPLLAIVGVFVINAPFGPPVLVLVFFHAMMLSRRMTTYEYLTDDRKGTRARRMEQEASLKASREPSSAYPAPLNVDISVLPSSATTAKGQMHELP